MYNVLLHAGSSVLLFLVLRRMTGALWRSAFVAAVFAVHPLRAESVAWVSERKDVLGAFFFMLTLAAYVRYVRKPDSVGRYLTVVGCFALGLLCKPIGITLPFVLLLLDYWPLRRWELVSPLVETAPPPRATGWLGLPRRLILEKIPLLALAAVGCVMTYTAEGTAVESVTQVNLPVRIGSALVSYVVYLRQMVCPTQLALFYPYAPNSQLLWEAPLAFSLLALICAAILALWRRHPWLLVGLLWYLGMMVPMIGIVAICPSPYGDRNTYLPQIGLYVLLTWAVAEWSTRCQYPRVLSGVLMVAVLAALTVAGHFQTSYWRNNRKLWTRVLDCTPENSTARNNLGAALLKDGEVDEAIAQFRKALQIKPAYPHAYYNLGLAFAKKEDWDQAVAQYRKALEIDPHYAEAWCNLGIALFTKGEKEDAILHYRKALDIKPNYAEARYNLALALFATGEKAKAVAQYQAALEINPAYSEARYNLANTLLQMGELDEAIAQYRKFLEIAPNDLRVLNNLGIALAVKGSFNDAIAQYRKALEINPEYADARFDLGMALLKVGNPAEAAVQYRKALQSAVAQKNARLAAKLDSELKRLEAATPERSAPP